MTCNGNCEQGRKCDCGLSTEGSMSDTPITDKVRAAIKESMTSRTQATYGTGYALRELDRLERELSAERAAREQAERNEVAIRELMNMHNLGGWTDALGPMKRALEAERELSEARAEVERLREWIDAMNNSASIDAARGKKP
jgi:hypothetical protein